VNYREVNGSLDGATAQEVIAEMKEEPLQEQRRTGGDIYSCSAHSAVFKMLLFIPTSPLSPSLSAFISTLLPLLYIFLIHRKGNLGLGGAHTQRMKP